MENGQLPDDKLFRAVHDRLSDYEAPYNGANWDAMSRSLDALPKSARFQWRISLNTLLIGAGLAGISLLGYSFASHSGKAGDKQPETKVSASGSLQPMNTDLTVSSTPSSAASLPQTNPLPENNGATLPADLSNNSANTSPENSALLNTDGSVKTKRRNNNSSNTLLFGDQIDRRKGFIYKTREDNALLAQPITDPEPNVFYDADNGAVKKILIHKDSSATHNTKKKASDSVISNTDAGAPTDGEKLGFDN